LEKKGYLPAGREKKAHRKGGSPSYPFKGKNHSRRKPRFVILKALTRISRKGEGGGVSKKGSEVRKEWLGHINFQRFLTTTINAPPGGGEKYVLCHKRDARGGN